MELEELFCKLYPEYSVNGKPLSPYFDLFESGYEQAENRIAEHKCECERCIHTDCPCVLSDYGKDRNGICDHFKDVFDENAELKEVIDNDVDKKIYVQLAKKAELADVQSEQLTKAKEIISEWEDSFCCGADYLYLGNKGRELRIKSQKFLNSEVEK